MFITRTKTKSGFIYSTKDKDDLERIKKLRIPPMWTSVQISKSNKSKLQATGFDAKGRKQYIYHADWIEKSKKKKYDKMKKFDYKYYSKVINDFIKKNDLSRDCVIANIIKIMEDLNIRVGNESYKKENGSYGITTMLKKHLIGNKLKFIGKKGINHTKIIKDKRSLDFIKRVCKIKGPNLFYDCYGRNISSSDLNEFLKNKVKHDVTCKDIRTYCANKIFYNYMKKLPRGKTEKERKKQITDGIDYTSNELGNTRKICKDSYLDPTIIDKFK